MDQLRVRKVNGELQSFDEERVRRSIRFSGLPSDLQDAAYQEVLRTAYDTISTTEIHRTIEKYLQNTFPRALGRFNLKTAIMSLGPTGFPFERLVGKLLSKYGYETQTDQIMEGACVSHEVDVHAKKEGKEFFIECKYHNQPGIKTDVKVIMYVKSRADDLRERLDAGGNNIVRYEPWIFTNTKFSFDAMKYALCKQIRLTGWGYPEGRTLNSMIEAHRMYPLTILTSLSLEEKQTLLEAEIVIVQDVLSYPNLLRQLHIEEKRLTELEDEIAFLQAT